MDLFGHTFDQATTVDLRSVGWLVACDGTAILRGAAHLVVLFSNQTLNFGGANQPRPRRATGHRTER